MEENFTPEKENSSQEEKLYEKLRKEETKKLRDEGADYMRRRWGKDENVPEGKKPGQFKEGPARLVVTEDQVERARKEMLEDLGSKESEEDKTDPQEEEATEEVKQEAPEKTPEEEKGSWRELMEKAEKIADGSTEEESGSKEKTSIDYKKKIESEERDKVVKIEKDSKDKKEISRDHNGEKEEEKESLEKRFLELESFLKENISDLWKELSHIKSSMETEIDEEMDIYEVAEEELADAFEREKKKEKEKKKVEINSLREKIKKLEDRYDRKVKGDEFQVEGDLDDIEKEIIKTEDELRKEEEELSGIGAEEKEKMKKRKEEVENLRKDGAEYVSKSWKKGEDIPRGKDLEDFIKDPIRLEVTEDQVEKARKEMLEDLGSKESEEDKTDPQEEEATEEVKQEAPEKTPEEGVQEAEIEKNENKGKEYSPLDWQEFLDGTVFDEKRENFIKRNWRRIRNFGGGIAGAMGIKMLLSKIPGVGNAIIGAQASGLTAAASSAGVGLFAGVGFRGMTLALEAKDELKKYGNFKSDIIEELERSEERSYDYLEEKMADLTTNISIIEGQLKKLNIREKELARNDKRSPERKEVKHQIKEYQKVLEGHNDYFRFLATEMKEREPGMNTESLVDNLIEGQKDRYEKMIEKGDGHGDLISKMLANLEGAEREGRGPLREKIEKAKIGLRAKLESRGKSIPKEIIKSAAFVAVLGGVSESFLQTEWAQGLIEKMGENISEADLPEPAEKVMNWILEHLKRTSDAAPESISVPEENDTLTDAAERILLEGAEEYEKGVLEMIDEAAGKTISYKIETGDNVWSITEEFLLDNVAEFSSLGEAEQTYVIDHITTLVENDPSSFGLSLAEGESIDHLFAESDHAIDFSKLLSEVDPILEQAQSITPEEVFSILENNETIREFIRNNPDTRITKQTIRRLLESGVEVTEEQIFSIIEEGTFTPMEGVTEIAHPEGDLTIKITDGAVTFSLDGDSFAEGSIGQYGDYYIPLHNEHQTDLTYTRAYNAARQNLDSLIEQSLQTTQIEQISESTAEMTNWLERMKSGNLDEAAFDFMIGEDKEYWLQQLSEIEGVTSEEMEEMIRESYNEIKNNPTEIQEMIEETTSSDEWLERMEENVRKLKNGEISPQEYQSLIENEEWVEKFSELNPDMSREMKEALLESYAEEAPTSGGTSFTESIREYNITPGDRELFRQNFGEAFLETTGRSVEFPNDMPNYLSHNILEGEISPSEYFETLESLGVDINPNRQQIIESRVNTYQNNPDAVIRNSTRRALSTMIYDDIGRFLKN